MAYRLVRPVICAVVLALASAPGFADPPPFPEFEAKRVKPPKSGTTRRITVQITPQATVRPTAPAEPPAASQATPLPRYNWFWENVSDKLEPPEGGRFEAALRVLQREAARVSSPRLQTLQDIAAVHGTELLRQSIGTRVSPALALAVISVESAGRVDAVSSAGAQGLMQLMPATAERFGVTDAMAASDNIQGGIAYLDWLMDAFDGDPVMVLAAYNAGEGAVRDHNGVPPYRETRDYVPKVLAAFANARGLCVTPPQLVSDGCVFAVMN